MAIMDIKNFSFTYASASQPSLRSITYITFTLCTKRWRVASGLDLFK